MATNRSDDFDPLKELEDNINQPHKFAAIFCAAATSQVNIRDTLKEVLRECLEYDAPTRAQIKKVIAEFDKESWSTTYRKIGFAGWSALLIFITAFATALANKIFS